MFNQSARRVLSVVQLQAPQGAAHVGAAQVGAGAQQLGAGAQQSLWPQPPHPPWRNSFLNQPKQPPPQPWPQEEEPQQFEGAQQVAGAGAQHDGAAAHGAAHVGAAHGAAHSGAAHGAAQAGAAGAQQAGAAGAAQAGAHGAAQAGAAHSGAHGAAQVGPLGAQQLGAGAQQSLLWCPNRPASAVPALIAIARAAVRVVHFILRFSLTLFPGWNVRCFARGPLVRS